MLILNLLPPQEKEMIRLSRINRLIIFYSGAIFVLLVIFIILLLVTLFFLTIQLKAIEKLVVLEEKSAPSLAMRNLEKEITLINQKLKMIDKIQTDSIPYSIILEDLAKMIPLGVQLFSFSFDSQTKKANLIGYAPERDQVLALKESLEKFEKFNQVESPISNLLKARDIDFRFSFVIK